MSSLSYFSFSLPRLRWLAISLAPILHGDYMQPSNKITDINVEYESRLTQHFHERWNPCLSHPKAGALRQENSFCLWKSLGFLWLLCTIHQDFSLILAIPGQMLVGNGIWTASTTSTYHCRLEPRGHWRCSTFFDLYAREIDCVHLLDALYGLLQHRKSHLPQLREIRIEVPHEQDITPLEGRKAICCSKARTGNIWARRSPDRVGWGSWGVCRNSFDEA